ncbi:Protein tailless [Frankliniella fusca]|uniref:Protein tailless n=1 Tax=Frankliniella fusca TaxID=407009 RepID=A0AAE1L553_9NEOP|nr:Protein tailless [Frankliniella fusca]
MQQIQSAPPPHLMDLRLAPGPGAHHQQHHQPEKMTTSSRILYDIPCKVCRDHSSGKHYGIFACDGCAGFFKRSIRRNRQYVCKAKSEGSCVVDKTHRNQCRACRLRKCVEAGMNRDAVQHERGPRNSTLRRQMAMYLKDAMPAHHHPHHHLQLLPPLGPPLPLPPAHLLQQPAPQPSPPSPLGSPRPALNLALPKLSPRSEDTSGTGSSHGSSPPPPPPAPALHPRLQFPGAAAAAGAHLNNTVWLQLQLLGLGAGGGSPPPPPPPPTTTTSTASRSPARSPAHPPPPPAAAARTPPAYMSPGREALPETVCEAAARLLFLNVQWARGVPAFTGLSLRDQLLLLQESWSELLVLAAAQFALPVGQDVLGLGHEDCRLVLQDTLAKFAALDVDAHEYSCLRAIVLFKTAVERGALVDVAAVAGLQDQAQLMLSKYTSASRPDQPCRFGKLLLLLPELRKVHANAIEDLFFRRTIGSIPIQGIICNMYSGSEP